MAKYKVSLIIEAEDEFSSPLEAVMNAANWVEDYGPKNLMWVAENIDTAEKTFIDMAEQGVDEE